MISVVKFLARLYPLAWRDRYGNEFDALIEDRPASVLDAADVLQGALKMQMSRWTFARITLASCVVGVIAAVAISFVRPALYRSQTVISVDTSDVRSIDLELAAQVNDALAEERLIPIIQGENLYPTERARISMSDVVALMRKNIMIRPLSTSGGKPASAFLFRFDYPDPHVAQRVDGMLVSSLMAANLRGTSGSAATTDFLKDQLEAAKDPAIRAGIQAQLQQAEGAEFHEAFRVMIPPDLPREPFLPNRKEFGAGGLLVGLAGGLMMAWVLRLRQEAALANG